VLADREKLVAFRQQPAVAGRIVGLEPDDDEVRARLERPVVRPSS